MSSTRFDAFRSTIHSLSCSSHSDCPDQGNSTTSKPSSSPGIVKPSAALVRTVGLKSGTADAGGNHSLLSSSVSSARSGGFNFSPFSSSSLTSSRSVFSSLPSFSAFSAFSAFFFAFSKALFCLSASLVFAHCSSMRRCFSRRTKSQTFSLKSASGSPMRTFATLRKCAMVILLKASQRSSFVRLPFTSITTKFRLWIPSTSCKTRFKVPSSTCGNPVLISGASVEVASLSDFRSPLREAHSQSMRLLSSV
mmetsp:Transcript_122899/g.347405  ORF Transcript_122899/g.347405 Transcript_122899/m.347405 type:complete len:251 (+) Transcript_122899:1586-2338(+)